MTGERGIALLTVMAGLVILSAIAASMLSTGRVSSRLAVGGVDRVKAEALIDAAVNRSFLGLVDRRIDYRWRVDGVPRDAVFKEYSISVAIQDDYGKIDLNAASGETIEHMLLIAGVASSEVDRLTDAILDWREKGELRRLHGAKAPDYLAAGFSYVPREGPFQTIDELQLVMGMTKEIFRKLEPIVTVYSHRQTLNTQTAPRAALLSLAGMDAPHADQLIQARVKKDASFGGGGPIIDGVIDPSIPLAGWPFTLRVDVPMGLGRLVREVVIRLTGDAKEPYWILAVRDVDDDAGRAR